MSMPKVTTIHSNNSDTLPKPKVELNDRETAEIIIGLVGPVGSGVSTTGEIIADILQTKFGYKIVPIRVSQIIEASLATDQKQKLVQYENNMLERIKLLQRAGTELREKNKSSYLAGRCIEEICNQRKVFKTDSGENIPQPERVV